MSMNTILIDIESKCLSKESPIGEDFALEIVKKLSDKSQDNLIESLIVELQKKSSKHKFLINKSRLASPEGVNANLNITTNFGAIWDSDRDGFITLKIVQGQNSENNDANGSEANEVSEGQAAGNTAIDSTLITIYWIYSG